MTEIRTPNELELSALLASKICHDIISPVGAVNNGLEVLEEGTNEEMRGIAMDLITKSARQASAKLQFARIAFGAAGSQGSEIDTGDAQQVAAGYFRDEKAEVEWNVPRIYLAKDKVKLLLNLLLIAASSIPRGGKIVVSGGGGETPSFELTAEGAYSRVPTSVEALLSGALEHPVDAHSIQPYYTGLLARTSGLTVSIAAEGEQIVIRALPA